MRHKKQKRTNSFDKVINSIVRVRKPGERPKESLFTFDDFECDLCKGPVPEKKLTQCAFCGRWICKETCWNTETMSCVSCAGIIKLSKESVGLEAEDKANSETERTGVKRALKRTGKKVKGIRKSQNKH